LIFYITITIFRAMLFFWNRDPKSRPLLALLCTIARDAVFRMSVPFIQSYADGLTVEKKMLEKYIGERNPERFRSVAFLAQENRI